MPDFGNECYISRELSWLEFDHRVLRQASSQSNPLFERLKYLSIVLSNLDEFYMIRVGSIHDQLASGYCKPDPAGLTPAEQLDGISKRVGKLYKGVARSYRELCGEICALGVRIFESIDELSSLQREFCRSFFIDTLYPILTPITIDRKHAFPFIPGRALNLALSLEKADGEERFAVVQLPTSIGRLIALPTDDVGDDQVHFITCEALVKGFISKLFPSMKVGSCFAWRITRNGDLDIDADEAGDLLEAVKKTLLRRKRGAVVRLEHEACADRRFVRILKKRLDIDDNAAFALDCPIDITYLLKVIYPIQPKKTLDAPLRYEPFTASVPDAIANLSDDDSILDLIDQGDILLHHPYQSFDPIVRMLRDAARDPAVVSVKITLYRLSSDSPVIKALIDASLAGKQVVAFVEARARFDEENNIEYGAELEQARVNVIYGLPKYKTHSKIILILRRENGRMRKYMHLGTGNYNDSTARQYTDCSLLTARDGMTADGVEFFRSLTGGMDEPDLEYLSMAPFNLRERFIDEIKRERKRAKAGEPADIFAKMNSLVDKDIIRELLRASRAGVRIRLLVRGICCLRPELADISHNIEVRSIVGRFLEHSRVYCFGIGDERRVYMSSADWMTRNLDRRVELLFPLLDRSIADRAFGELELYWSDTQNALRLCADGRYRPLETDDGKSPLCAQEAMLALHCKPTAAHDIGSDN